MIKKMILILALAAVATGGYIPSPSPVPMGDFIIYQGQVFEGTFDIEDPNGPAGLTISCSPAGLIISEPNITTIEGFTDARKYVYPFRFTAGAAGVTDFTITATDSLGVAVTQQIKFEVRANAPHVFTGCRGGVGGHSKAWDKYDTQWQLLSPKVTNGNIYVMQMRSRENGRGVETNIYRQ